MDEQQWQEFERHVRDTVEKCLEEMKAVAGQMEPIEAVFDGRFLVEAAPARFETRGGVRIPVFVEDGEGE